MAKIDTRVGEKTHGEQKELAICYFFNIFDLII